MTNAIALDEEMTESRHKLASTIFCSQIAPSGWHTNLGNETISELILDRIIHDSYQILVDGEISMRERLCLLSSKVMYSYITSSLRKINVSLLSI